MSTRKRKQEVEEEELVALPSDESDEEEEYEESGASDLDEEEDSEDEAPVVEAPPAPKKRKTAPATTKTAAPEEVDAEEVPEEVSDEDDEAGAPGEDDEEEDGEGEDEEGPGDTAKASGPAATAKKVKGSLISTSPNVETMRNSEKLPIRPSHSQDQPAQEYLHNASGQRVDTDAVIAKAIREQYPRLHLTITPQYNCNLLSYAAAGHAFATPITGTIGVGSTSLQWKKYAPPATRLDNQPGVLFDQIFFGKYTYNWKGHEFILYLVDGRDPPFMVKNNYILSKSEDATSELIMAASQYSVELHDEIFVFDQGYWQKSKELWQSAQNTHWQDVILDSDMKKAIVGDVQKFFNSRLTYTNLRVPWKRGIIYHGPPGNGKTISIKATMHTLYNRDDPVPTLYVRSLARSYAGPENALSLIFSKARETAPCYLVFEDLDSIVTNQVRSYFLNEVDGLQNNDGILMVGSTNHLDRLDPGLSKRPSRFDRKYYFPDPNMEQRVKYCEYWQNKLSDNDDIEFPEEICTAVANITDGFSFAYIQEAFVGALLVIANEDKLFVPSEKGDDDDLDKYILWRQIKKQIKILRDEMGDRQRMNKEAPVAS
ncbi:MAG: hypothetical protein Q9187_004591 [Circinaria calcarea]